MWQTKVHDIFTSTAGESLSASSIQWRSGGSFSDDLRLKAVHTPITISKTKLLRSVVTSIVNEKDTALSVPLTKRIILIASEKDIDQCKRPKIHQLQR